ncbi:hypothetical protein HDU79_007358 [Rhizoclosmatium sp. JEL0117]|nr:hypothetical protein HDU79_007358 [Rhizoclosmatium sp. JEL0117]
MNSLNSNLHESKLKPDGNISPLKTSESNGIPLKLKLRLLALALLPIAAVAIVSSFLSAKVDESSPNFTHPEKPHRYVNASGSILMQNAWQRSFIGFSNFILQQQSGYTFDFEYVPASNAVGLSDFFHGYNLFGGVDSDVSKGDLKYFLPDDGSGLKNVSQYVDSRAPAHLGNIIMPVMGGALGVVYNIPGLPSKKQLNLNASVLGDIFCGAISKWNDPTLQALNPDVTLPAENINVIARGDNSATNSMLGAYVYKYSKKYYSTIGVTSTPKWPKSFAIGNSAIELVYMLNSLQYSISYIPMETITQAKLLGIPTTKASIINANRTATSPENDYVVAGMEAVAKLTPFSRHNYISIFDVNAPNAYPISILSYALLREHYYYDESASDVECDRIKALVYFFYFYFSNIQLQIKNMEYGGVPIAGRLLEKNIEALMLITCNRRNVADELDVEIDRIDFYANKTEEFEWDNAIPFWENSIKYKSSPISTGLYLVFYAALICCNLFPFGFNMFRYFTHGGSSHGETKENNLTKSIKTGSVVGSSDDADDDLEEDKEEAAARKAGKVTFSFQNRLGIITQYITCFQILYLCMTRSVAIQHNVYLEVVSWLGIIPDLYPYYVILNFTVFIWILCMVYTNYVYVLIEKYSPRTLFKLTIFHMVLADFLPNYAVIMYNPSVELLIKIFDCRLSTLEWDYLNSYHDFCWEKSHWGTAIVSFVLVCTFTNFVVRYSKVLKMLRKQFDFRDEDWQIYVDSVVKTFMLILYYNLKNINFLGVAFCLLLFMASGSFLGQPNEIFWFNYFRGGVHIYCSIVCLVLFVLELLISVNDYQLRHQLNDTLSAAILGITLGLSVLSYAIFVIKYKAGLNKAQRKAKEAELKQFFAAFGDEETDDNNIEAEVHEGQLRKAISDSSLISTGASNVGASQVNIYHNSGSKNGFSATQWKKFDMAIDSAKKLKMFDKDEAKAIKVAIKYEDPLIPMVFERCGKDLTKFVDYLKLKVHQILARSQVRSLEPSMASAGQHNRKPSMAGSFIHSNTHLHADPVLKEPGANHHIGIQSLRAPTGRNLSRPTSQNLQIESMTHLRQIQNFDSPRDSAQSQQPTNQNSANENESRS